MLDAFIQQTYGSIDGIIEAELRSQKLEEAKKKMAEEFHKKAVLEMNKSQEIKSKMEIPTKIKKGELDQKTVPHPKMAAYDHSLELDRKSIVREKYLNEKYKNNPEEKPSEEEFRLQGLETGSVEEMFNNMFKN